MNQTKQDDLADTVGMDAARSELLTEIVAKVGSPDPEASDDDLDLWWGLVEIDRLASGLTLATIAKLSHPGGDEHPAGPWLQTSDETGDAPTQLTPQGKLAIRQSGALHREA
ncbi:hypothetical protein Q4F19_09540 [Sphingomonas sp. BIUV-7]|uniref:Uncharacterized protein n=1 Tax=Sphingomonas natans TaxID=3063330 RepID=A0ABT8Y8F9_9SPHN|nr:hypothetical protein [Sphingomonas sp. BIUV-7]MDO6414621.1 hypothetical protein [Sphingomonas sp. BIUV-7]